MLLFLFQKLVFADDLKILVKSSGCESPRHCVFTMTPVDFSTEEDLGPANVFFPSNLSDAIGLQDPQLKVEILWKLIVPLFLYKSLLVTWRLSHAWPWDPFFQISKVAQLSKTEFRVSVQAQSPACFVWLVAKDVRGRFSENGFLLTEPSKTVLTLPIYFFLSLRYLPCLLKELCYKLSDK